MKFFSNNVKKESPMKNIKVLGIDLAKNVFQLHGTNGQGKCVLRKRLSRKKLKEFLVQLPPCLIGIEACMGAHYWARTLEQMGHTVKMMAPQFVKPYVKSNKNDRNDAKGIAEAVTRPDMKFVPIKKIDQQDILLIHRARELALKQRVAQGNQIRGLLAEYGIVIAQGVSQIRQLRIILEENKNQLTPLSQALFEQLYEQFKITDEQVNSYDQQIQHIAQQDERCREIMKIEGIGPVCATAAVATIGDARLFKRGREVSAWLGLVPKQYSSGNKIRLCGISKRGDRYLRTVLIHGARSVVNSCENKKDARSVWLADKKRRGGKNVAAVALANKNVRIIWAMLRTGECYRRSIPGQACA
jgi:transposase